MTEWRISPSLVNLMQCEARALAQYLHGYKEPEAVKATEGKRLHAAVQDYLVLGKQPDVSDVAAQRMLLALPTGPGSITRDNVERKVELPGFSGYIDFRQLGMVGDLKWTSSLKYQLDVDPETDPQRIIYAANELHITKADTVQLVWCVAQLNGKRHSTIKHTWSRKKVKTLLTDVVEPVRKRFHEHLAAKSDWQTADKDCRQCNKYPPNGCMMQTVGCNRTLKQLVEAIIP